MKTEDDIAEIQYKEIGRFVALYSQIETMVRSVYYRYCGVDDEVGRAITGGMRLIDIIASVKRVIIVKQFDQQMYDSIESIFRDLSELAKFRDKLVHRQWNVIGDMSELSNVGTAKANHLIEVEKISPKEIMTWTLKIPRIIVPLSTHLLTHEIWLANREAFQKIQPSLVPWFETPGLPARSQPEPRQAPQSQPRRPKP